MMGGVLTSAAAVAFVPSTDLDRSRRFYESVLGLEVIQEDDFAVSLNCAGLTVRVTDVGPEFHVQPFTVFGWHVDDVHATSTELARRGVEFLRVDGLEQDDDGVWTTPDGSHVAWFKDPDANTLSLTSN